MVLEGMLASDIVWARCLGNVGLFPPSELKRRKERKKLLSSGKLCFSKLEWPDGLQWGLCTWNLTPRWARAPPVGSAGGTGRRARGKFLGGAGVEAGPRAPIPAAGTTGRTRGAGPPRAGQRESRERRRPGSRALQPGLRAGTGWGAARSNAAKSDTRVRSPRAFSAWACRVRAPSPGREAPSPGPRGRLGPTPTALAAGAQGWRGRAARRMLGALPAAAPTFPRARLKNANALRPSSPGQLSGEEKMGREWEAPPWTPGKLTWAAHKQSPDSSSRSPRAPRPRAAQAMPATPGESPPAAAARSALLLARAPPGSGRRRCRAGRRTFLLFMNDPAEGPGDWRRAGGPGGRIEWQQSPLTLSPRPLRGALQPPH